jgi:CHASE2 domain-containing sensor protein
MTKNTGNCDYQDRAGKIILINTTKEHVIGAELHGNFRRNLLAAALKQRNLSLEGRLM